MAGRKNQGDQRGREQHFDNRNVPVIAAEYSGERVCVIDAETFGGACRQKQMGGYVSLCMSDERGQRSAGRWVILFTNSKAAMVLVKCDEVERWGCHGCCQAGGLNLRSLDVGLSRWMI